MIGSLGHLRLNVGSSSRSSGKTVLEIKEDMRDGFNVSRLLSETGFHIYCRIHDNIIVVFSNIRINIEKKHRSNYLSIQYSMTRTE